MENNSQIWFRISKLPDLTLMKCASLEGNGIGDILEKHLSFLRLLNRKGIISNISFSDVSQVYEYRLMLEPEICSKAAPIMDKSLCLKWKEYFNNLLLNKKSKPPVNDSDDIDKLFHLSISQSLNNNLINKDIAHLMDLSQRIRFLSNKQNEQRYIASINEHISILDAIIKGDCNLAREMMKKHLKNTVEGY